MVEIERAYPSLRAHLIGVLGIFAASFLSLTQYLYLSSHSLFADALQKDLSGDLEWMSSIMRSDPGVACDPARSDSFCNTVARFKSYRVTIIGASLCVLSKSHVPMGEVGSLKKHADSSEMRR